MTRIYAKGRVTTIANIKRMRRAPRGGTTLVRGGDNVKALDTVALVERATEYRLINLAEKLEVDPKEVASLMLKKEGEPVEEGEELALRRRLFRKMRIISPIDGTIAKIGGGQLLLEGKPIRKEVHASIPGRVSTYEPGFYVIVEANGASIQIPWGTGGLAWGTLKVMDETPSITTTADRFTIDHRGAVVAIGSPVTKDFLDAAVDIRVKGVIASSVNASLIPQLEEAGIPIGVTQGFGTLPMSSRILSVLQTYNGREIALDMSMPLDWRDTRPEIIIPITTSQNVPEDRDTGSVFRIGHRVRLLQAPYLGEIGTITAISEEPRQLESGLWMPGAFVEVPSGETVYVPFVNLEHLG